MDFPETEPRGAPRILPGQVIRGDVCRYRGRNLFAEQRTT
jgi:hypothetical protein